MKIHIFNNRALGKTGNSQDQSMIRPYIAGKEAGNDIDRLFVASRKGLWGLLIFIAASIIAFYFRDQGLTSCLPPDIREMIGPVPPMFLVNLVVWVSTFSSLIIIGGRIYHGREPGKTGTHLFFRLLFYLLYFAVDSLSGYYHALFISGLVVLALQHYNIWNYTSRTIDMKTLVVESPPLFQRRVSGK